jgi:hypothetical protein
MRFADILAVAASEVMKVTLPFPTFTLSNVTNSPAGTFTKTSGGSAWNGKAQAGPYTGDMEFIFTCSLPGTTEAWAGFAEISNAATPGQAKATAHFYTDGNVHEWDNGSYIGSLGVAYTGGAVHRFRRVAGAITYSHAGVDKATYTVDSAMPLYFAFGLSVVGDAIVLTSAAYL